LAVTTTVHDATATDNDKKSAHAVSRTELFAVKSFFSIANKWVVRNNETSDSLSVIAARQLFSNYLTGSFTAHNSCYGLIIRG